MRTLIHACYRMRRGLLALCLACFGPVALAEMVVPGDPQRVDEISVAVGGLDQRTGVLPADGQSLVPVRVKLLDAQGIEVKGRIALQVAAGNLRVVTKRAGQNDPSANPANKSGPAHIVAGTVEAVDGIADFYLVAPSIPMDVPLSIQAGSVRAKGTIAFAPDLRPLIAAGLVEGIVHFGSNAASAITPATGLSDNFERELNHFQRQFNDGDITLAGRTAFFVKGAIKGRYLLTATFDSEKDPRSRVLADINPDKYYPVMGDASVRGLEARSSDRLYVRLDEGKNYLLYGDFSTAEGLNQPLDSAAAGTLVQRQLGQYNRTMTGLRTHRRDEKGFLDAFAMRDSLRQAVEEYRANGTSGPFAVGNVNALENSEKIETVVRDRNNPSRILSITPMVRFVDYSFEPFNGQILFKAPIGSLDPNLNPVSIRVTYEVDTGGAPFWVYGFSGQRKLSPSVEVGVSYMKDENTGAPSGGVGYATTVGSAVAIPRELRELRSANVGLKLGENNQLVAEVAQALSATPDNDISGLAARVDWLAGGAYVNPFTDQGGLKYESRMWAGTSEKDFNNPATSYTGGRSDFGLRLAAELSADAKVLLEGIVNDDLMAGTNRNAESVLLEQRLDAHWSLNAGIRHVHQSEGAVASLSSSASSVTMPGQSTIFGASGLNPSGAGFWGTGAAINPATGQPQSMLNGQVLNSGLASPAIDAWTVRAGATYALQENWRVGAEVGQDVGINNDPYWAAVSTQYAYSKGRFFGRVETPTGRAAAGGDYRVTDNVSLYGRYENTNGLASSYALDSAAKSEALIFGVRQTNGNGMENFSELRLTDTDASQELANATGLRNTFPISPGLKGNVNAERLKILNGAMRGATALGGGLEWKDALWRGTARLEWRQLDASAVSGADDAAESWMNTISLARKLGDDWTALVRNYLLVTDNHLLDGNQTQNRFQLGAAYRPQDASAYDVLLRYENKFERNQEINTQEYRVVNLVSANLNYHVSRNWWTMGRLAAKSVNEDLTGVRDNYNAWLVSGRVIYDFTENWDLGLMTSMLASPGSQQYAYGLEFGYLLDKNVWVSLGYNESGFSDRDLTGSDYTRQGFYLRLRMKFDETSLESAAHRIKARFVEE